MLNNINKIDKVEQKKIEFRIGNHRGRLIGELNIFHGIDEPISKIRMRKIKKENPLHDCYLRT